MGIERFTALAEVMAFEDGQLVFELVVQQLLIMELVTLPRDGLIFLRRIGQ